MSEKITEKTEIDWEILEISWAARYEEDYVTV